MRMLTLCVVRSRNTMLRRRMRTWTVVDYVCTYMVGDAEGCSRWTGGHGGVVRTVRGLARLGGVLRRHAPRRRSSRRTKRVPVYALGSSQHGVDGLQGLSRATTVSDLPSSRRVSDRLTLPALPPCPASPTAHHGTPAKPRAPSTSRARGLVSSAEEGECAYPRSARESTDLACAVASARARRRRASESASLRERTRRGGLSVGMVEGEDGIRIAYVCTYSLTRGRAVWRSSRQGAAGELATCKVSASGDAHHLGCARARVVQRGAHEPGRSLPVSACANPARGWPAAQGRTTHTAQRTAAGGADVMVTAAGPASATTTFRYSRVESVPYAQPSCTRTAGAPGAWFRVQGLSRSALRRLAAPKRAPATSAPPIWPICKLVPRARRRRGSTRHVVWYVLLEWRGLRGGERGGTRD